MFGDFFPVSDNGDNNEMIMYSSRLPLRSEGMATLKRSPVGQTVRQTGLK